MLGMFFRLIALSGSKGKLNYTAILCLTAVIIYELFYPAAPQSLNEHYEVVHNEIISSIIQISICLILYWREFPLSKVSTHTCTRTHVHAYTRTRVHTYTRTRVHTYTYLSTFITSPLHRSCRSYLIWECFCYFFTDPKANIIGYRNRKCHLLQVSLEKVYHL